MCDNSNKTAATEHLIEVLNQALQNMQNNELALAKVFVGVARQMLDDLYLDLEHHLQVEKELRALMKPPISSK